MTEPTSHMTPEISDRGFKRLPFIAGTYGGYVRAYESSAASGPHIWLNSVEELPNLPRQDATVHLTVEGAQQLIDQLTYLIHNHYQK